MKVFKSFVHSHMTVCQKTTRYIHINCCINIISLHISSIRLCATTPFISAIRQIHSHSFYWWEFRRGAIETRVPQIINERPRNSARALLAHTQSRYIFDSSRGFGRYQFTGGCMPRVYARYLNANICTRTTFMVHTNRPDTRDTSQFRPGVERETNKGGARLFIFAFSIRTSVRCTWWAIYCNQLIL